MKMISLAAALFVALPALGQDDKPKAAERANADIAAHRAIAAAHEKAAKCLESGKSEKECHAHLAKDCQGIALGKYCGMRHRH